MVNPSPRRAERGSTLVECMIASVVVTAVALGFGAAEPAQANVVRHAFEDSVALRVASAELERLRAAPVLVVQGRHDLPVDSRASAQLAAPCAERSVRFVEPGLAEVTVQVTWTPHGTDRRRSRELVTRILTGAPR